MNIPKVKREGLEGKVDAPTRVAALLQLEMSRGDTNESEGESRPRQTAADGAGCGLQKGTLWGGVGVLESTGERLPQVGWEG